MAKRVGSKGSRSGRRADKDRVLRARERGLPERPPELQRARAATPAPQSQEFDSAGEGASVARAKSSAVPPWVWVAGVALGLLGVAYVVSVQRNEALTRPAPEAPAVPEASSSASGGSAPAPGAVESDAEVAPSPEPETQRDRAGVTSAEVTPPRTVAPTRPSVAKPSAPPPAARPVPRPSDVTVAPPASVSPPLPPTPATPPAAPPLTTDSQD